MPDGLVVRILGFHCHGLGSVPGGGTGIPQALCCAQNKKKDKRKEGKKKKEDGKKEARKRKKSCWR